MMRKRFPFALRLALTATVLALAAQLGGCAGGPRGGFQMPPMPVEVAPVETQPITDRFHAVGTIEANENVKVVSEVNAVVRELPFAEGQSVAKGALIAHLEDSDLKAESARTDALRDQARTTHQRIQQLFDQKAASQQELDDAAAAVKVADANYEVARTRAAKALIHSPLSGVIGRRLVSPGQYLSVGQAITEVASVDVMKIAFSSPERYLPQLKRGASVEIITTAFPGRAFVGTITVVDPILDPVSRTVQVVARIPNRGRVLRPGLSADVNATLGEQRMALLVPDEAVFAEGDQNFVYVVNPDSSVVRQAIVVGARDSSHAEVVQGLKRGDRVVAAGYQKLFPGAKVMPMPPGGVPGGGPGAAAAPAGGSGAKRGGK